MKNLINHITEFQVVLPWWGVAVVAIVMLVFIGAMVVMYLLSNKKDSLIKTYREFIDRKINRNSELILQRDSLSSDVCDLEHQISLLTGQLESTRQQLREVKDHHRTESLRQAANIPDHAARVAAAKAYYRFLIGKV